MNHRKLIYFLLVLFTLNSCHKDSLSENEDVTTVFTATVVDEITGKIVGYVYDEQNKPVKDALVQIYSSSTKTNEYGLFVFENAKMDKQGTYLTVRKAGFILGSDLVYPDEKAVSYSRIGLLALETNKTFSANDGGEVTISGGGNITFPAAAISYLDGSSYNGNVYVTAKLLSTTNPNLEEIMPGGLVGDAINGATVAMGSAGMVAVELRDDKGEELNLTTGKTATITMPATSSAKPENINLWSFDESKGRWNEEGTAKLQGENYVAEVSHFSFWNCDAPFPLVTVCGKVVDQDGKPVANAWVSVEPDGFWASGGITNSEGVFCGLMPKDVKLVFKVRTTNCGNVIFEKEIGPLTQNTVLDPFVITLVTDNQLKISGQVVCNGTPVQDAIIVINVDGKYFTFIVNKETGFFEYDLSYLICQTNFTQAKIFAYDNNSGKASDEQVVTVGATPNNVIIDICEPGCDFTAEFSYDCNNILSIAATNGSGSFQYLWSTGSKERSIQLAGDSTQGLYCVTVTDSGASGCTKTFCKQINGKLGVGMEAGCWGYAQAYAFGGLAPYTYEWSNGATTVQIPVVTIGTYCVTVTDVAGCTASTCRDVIENPIFLDPNPAFCNANLFSLNSSPFAGGNIWNTNGSSQLQVQSLQNLNVFETGFNFRILLFNGQCEADFSITLPQIDTLNAEGKNPTCATCNDGYILYNLGTQCNQCTIGDVIILTADGLLTDVTSQNNAKTLGKGFYYVVVKDANTGCYIGFKKIELKI